MISRAVTACPKTEGNQAVIAFNGGTNMDINLTPIFEAIIALLAAVVTYKLVPWIKSKVTEQQYSNLTAAAKIAVYAAEQIYKFGNGDKKLDYAVEQLRARGFNLDIDILRSAVEQAVYEMNTENKITDSYLQRGKTNDESEPEEEDTEDYHLPTVEKWPLEMIMAFFDDNNIPHDGCRTKEDYLHLLSLAAEDPGHPPDDTVAAKE